MLGTSDEEGGAPRFLRSKRHRPTRKSLQGEMTSGSWSAPISVGPLARRELRLSSEIFNRKVEYISARIECSRGVLARRKMSCRSRRVAPWLREAPLMSIARKRGSNGQCPRRVNGGLAHEVIRSRDLATANVSWAKGRVNLRTGAAKSRDRRWRRSSNRACVHVDGRCFGSQKTARFHERAGRRGLGPNESSFAEY